MSEGFSIDQEVQLLRDLCEAVADRLQALAPHMPDEHHRSLRMLRAEALGLGDALEGLKRVTGRDG